MRKFNLNIRIAQQRAGAAALGAALAIAVFSACFGGGDAINTGDSVDTGAISGVGGALVSGDWEVTLHSFNRSGENVTVTVELTNVGSSFHSPPGTAFGNYVIIDDMGREYSLNDRVALALTGQLLPQINPGFSLPTIPLVFSVPANASGLLFQFRGGLFSPKVLFRLNQTVQSEDNSVDDVNNSYSLIAYSDVIDDDSHSLVAYSVVIDDDESYRILSDEHVLVDRDRFFSNRSPSWSPDGSRIAFVSTRDGNPSIYTMLSDGSDVRRLTDNETRDFNPSWSPDGSRIAFYSNRDGDYEIYTMALDGSDVRQLTNNETDDFAHSWSPDGSRIAFISQRDGDYEIYTMASDGSDVRQLTNNETDDFAPSWSPDGSRIAFSSRSDSYYDYDSSDIYTIASDGFDVRRLTDDEFSGSNSNPSWSPDGSRIAFVSNRAYWHTVFSSDDPNRFFDNRDRFFDNRAGYREIYTMSPDGSDVRRLTDNESSDSELSWSPDGSRIAFVSRRAAGRAEIYTMSPDGSDVRRLTNSQFSDFAHSWSPDGSRIAFYSNRDGDDFELYTRWASDRLDDCADACGSDVRRLTDNRADDRHPAWSPDGSRIAFSSDRDGDLEIYTMLSDGSDVRQLTDNQSDDEYPSWSPDGSRIAFSSNRDGDYQIYTMLSDGSDVRRLIELGGANIPSWSPDGSRIAFISDRGGDYEIYTISSDGSDVKQLTINESDDFAPSWSPDGSRIAFTSNSGNYWRIYTMSSDGSDVKALNTIADNRGHPFENGLYVSWSPILP